MNLCKYISNLFKGLRFRAGFWYLVFSLIALAGFLISGLKFLFPNVFPLYLRQFIWCLSWAAFGIGSGLINSRDNESKRLNKVSHYFFYFGFVLLIATLAAFIPLTSIKDNFYAAYATAALAGIVVGFTGDALAGKIEEYMPK